MNWEWSRIEQMFREILERLDRIERKFESEKKQCPADPLSGDRLLDNQDMCLLLDVTKRTLARYRQKKLVSYYKIDGRVYYKASEVMGFLRQKGKALDKK